MKDLIKESVTKLLIIIALSQLAPLPSLLLLKPSLLAPKDLLLFKINLNLEVFCSQQFYGYDHEIVEKDEILWSLKILLQVDLIVAIENVIR